MKTKIALIREWQHKRHKSNNQIWRFTKSQLQQNIFGDVLYITWNQIQNVKNIEMQLKKIKSSKVLIIY